MIIIFCAYEAVPDVLVEKFFGVFGIEGILCAVITIVKTVLSKLVNKELEVDEESVEDEYYDEE